MIRRRVVVRGRVQGVFFRDGARRQAAAAGVAGWIHNRSDGAVEAAVEGDQTGVESLVAWMREGPERAQVEDVEVVEEEPEGLDGFDVR